MKQLYELWETRQSYTFFAAKDRERNIAELLWEGEPRLVWTVEATSWEEACTKKHEFLGWEPYVPMRDPG